MFLLCRPWQGLIEWLVVSWREPRTRKQTNRIPHKYKFCIKLGTSTCAHKRMCTYSRLHVSSQCPFFLSFLSRCHCSRYFICIWFEDLHLDFQLLEAVSFRIFFGSLRREPSLIKILIKCMYFDMGALFQLCQYSSAMCIIYH